MTETTINSDEVEKFGRMAEEWWNPAGKFRPLHRFNPVRLGYIREHVLAHFGREAAQRRPFEDLRFLDLGCGGGLVTEPMARLGATVVGIDPAERNVAVARLHAAQSGLDIDYRATTAEQLAAAGEQFDVVLNMEVVEHVDNVRLYMQSCAALVAPGGLLFTATINRTARSFALAIVGAEYILNWLPRGTHNWSKFLTPEEVGALVERNGMAVTNKTGVVYNPLRDEWRQGRDMGVNYMVLASKARAATQEVELSAPPGDVTLLVPAACAAEGLTCTLQNTLKGHPGSTHWHFKRRRERGTLEITWHPATRRLWMTVQEGRKGPWIDDAVERLKARLASPA
jgi:2-polyprenyl-6-hydroxyphenyl methylase/3-demethylubiquinone-9 3-methyltransferase